MQPIEIQSQGETPDSPVSTLNIPYQDITSSLLLGGALWLFVRQGVPALWNYFNKDRDKFYEFLEWQRGYSDKLTEAIDKLTELTVSIYHRLDDIEDSKNE